MYDAIIESASKQYKIEPKLIRAIISVESNWNQNAVRHEPQINDTSWGLMQVLLSTARRVSGNSNLTSGQLVQPTVNILIGTKYLRELTDRYQGRLTDVIAAYNAGSAFRAKSDPTKYTNQGYVDKVLSAYKGPELAALALPIGAVFLVGLIALGGRR